MIECYIRRCMDQDDPFYLPEIMSGLSDTRKNKIMKYKLPDDRKRSLVAGLMMRDVLNAHGMNSDNIKITENGRPVIDGIDFNVSHSGEYVFMVISDSKVGCDIERIKERNYSVARRYFSDGEKKWMKETGNTDLSFYRIWTARESYIKLTGEGILLDFAKYETYPIEDKDESVQDQICKGEYLGSFSISREGQMQNVVIKQWLYDKEYVISICRKQDENNSN